MADTAPGGADVSGTGEGAVTSGGLSKLGIIGATLSLTGSSHENLDDFVDVFRGTDMTMEIMVQAETGMIMSDAARQHFLENTMGGELTARMRIEAVGRAGVAAVKRHAELVAKFGGEENLARAQTLTGTEFPDGPRSMFSVTKDIETARKFAGTIGKVFHTRINKHKLIRSPVKTSTESEFFIRAQTSMQEVR